MFSKETYVTRRDRLRRKMKSGVILFPGNGESPVNYKANTFHFRQDSNFLYFFGLNHPDYVGLLDVESGVDSLYGDDYTIDDIIWMGPQPSLKEKAQSVGVNGAYPMKDLYAALEKIIRSGRTVHFLPPYRAQNIQLLESLTGISHSHLGQYVSEELIKAVVSLREIKNGEEIARIEEACEIGYQMHTAAMKMCRPGLVERDIAGEIEGIALSKGAGVSFHSIVSQNGETLHNHYHGNVLEAGRLLLIDAGAEDTMNYCSDFTRTIPVGGTFSQKQKDIYNIVLAANDKAFELIKPGVTYKSVHLECSKVIAQGLIGLGLMKGDAGEAVANGAHALFMPHGLGHQMGLDVHDMEDLGENYVGYDEETQRSTQFGLGALRMGKRLSPGHVFTVEPGIYFIPALIKKWETEKINHSFICFDKLRPYLDFGGIRIEDDALVTENGSRMLGKKRIPATVEQIEDFMQKDTV